MNTLLLVFCLLIIEIYSDTEFAKYFYDLAVVNCQNASRSDIKLAKPLRQVHLIRIPKASSTSLSVVSRRVVGCQPPGPCCRWPGDPIGSCPSKRLFACQTQQRVIGCTHHQSFYNALMDRRIYSISIIRHPYRRSVSAFFYPGIHHNEDCTKAQRGKHECFLEYTADPRWKNIAVKLLTGLYAYSPERVCRTNKECRNSLELALHNLEHVLDFMGVAEMWELSLLIMHMRIGETCPPNLEEFQLSSKQRNHRPDATNTTSHSLRRSLKSHDSLSQGKQQAIGDNSANPFPRRKRRRRSQIISYKRLNSSRSLKNKITWAAGGRQPPQLTMSSNIINQNDINSRANTDSQYVSFKSTANETYAKELRMQNELDLELYFKAVELLCQNVHKFQLWNYPIVRDYWRSRSPVLESPCGLSLSSFRDISSAEEDEVEKDGLSFSIGGYMTQCNKVEQ
eukprot:gene24070-32486_t